MLGSGGIVVEPGDFERPEAQGAARGCGALRLVEQAREPDDGDGLDAGDSLGGGDQAVLAEGEAEAEVLGMKDAERSVGQDAVAERVEERRRHLTRSIGT